MQVADALRYLHEEKGVVHRYGLLLITSYDYINRSLANTVRTHKGISSQRTYFSSRSHLFPQRIPDTDLPRMKTKKMKANSSPASALVALDG